MIARLLAVIAIALPSLAAAQDRDLPLGLDLNGLWELEERGELLASEKAIVEITQTPAGLVTANFLSGAECFNGMARPYAFVGQLSFTVPGQATLSAPTMFVCSGSSSAVKKCGGSIPAMYASKFTGVDVVADLTTGKPSLITGARFAQGYEDCTPNSKFDGTHPFTLRRVSCPEEARKVAERESALRDIFESIKRARGLFLSMLDDVQQQYGETYNGQPTAPIGYPWSAIDGDWDADMELTEEFFANFPGVVATDQWQQARAMLRQMASDTASPLATGAELMLIEIYRIERLAPDGTRALEELRAARAQLEACLQKQ